MRYHLVISEITMKGLFPVVTPRKKDLIFKHLILGQIMTSVFYLSENEKTKGIHDIFPQCRNVFLDSGIFQMYKQNPNKKLVITYRDTLIKIYNQLQPNFASALDIPSTIWDNVKTKRERIKWSLENYEYLRERVSDSIVLVPGVCAFSAKSAKIVARQIKRIIGSPKYLGIGGQVPLLKIAEKSPGLALLSMEVFSIFRKEFPKAKIHVFGAGGHRWYMLLRLLGANSADYAGYLFSAGIGEIILPGIRPKYILRELVLQTKKGKKKYQRDPARVFTEKEFDEFDECDCPVCKQDSPIILELNKDSRLLHNLFVVNSEAQIVDEFCEAGDFDGLKRHIRDRLLCRDSGIKPVVKRVLYMGSSR